MKENFFFNINENSRSYRELMKRETQKNKHTQETEEDKPQNQIKLKMATKNIE